MIKGWRAFIIQRISEYVCLIKIHKTDYTMNTELESLSDRQLLITLEQVAMTYAQVILK